MVRQKAVNFDLLRENANLKSQLESLQNTVNGLKLDARNDKTEEKNFEKAKDEASSAELRVSAQQSRVNDLRTQLLAAEDLLHGEKDGALDVPLEEGADSGPGMRAETTLRA